MALTVIALDALPGYIRDALASGVDRVKCPRCGGGTSGESSLSIRPKDDGVLSLWCYRSSCGFKALSVLDSSAKFTAKKLKEATVYREATRPVTLEHGTILIADYGLRVDTWTEHGWRSAVTGDWLVMPIRDCFGREIGHVTRSLLSKPKRVLTYKATDRSFMDWWLTESTAPVVVVEDALSACRLSGLGYNSVALLGTGMSRDDARELTRGAEGREIYLALDRDAFGKALQLADRHRHLVRFSQVLCLNEDLKDVDNDDEIYRILGSNDGRHDAMCSGLRE